ncbi:hypothetical protein TYRP_001171 [Tyrophagus putrescentiae]|nr:hypothetical protein TYRP_001171 [Tyrophagus putrescentiae]
MYRPVKVRRVKLNKNKLAMQTKEEPSTTTFLQLTDDCLLVLFTQLTLIEAFKLGSSCRRLYDLYQKAFKDRRSLVLWLPEQFYGMYFYEDIFDSKPFCSVSSANHFLLSKWVAPTRTLFARLPNLVSLEIKNICGFEKTIPYLINYLNTSMPVLPSVESFSLDDYDSYFHADPLEFLQLEHCFPKLKQISVSIRQYECEYCDYKSAAEDTATFQRCFLKLARGLLRLGKTGGDITAWESAVKVKKADFWFRYFCFFTSLDNLVAGIKKVYKND